MEAALDTTLALTTEFIKLDALLKVTGVAGSGGQAKLLILDGLVLLNGDITTQRGRKIRAGDVVTVELEPQITITVE